MNGETIGRPMEILLVEDSLTSARLTIGALKKGSFQHRLTWLTDGESAIAFLTRQERFARAAAGPHSARPRIAEKRRSPSVAGNQG
jgi:chemotaxis family two-component system response regulator Rcp1